MPEQPKEDWLPDEKLVALRDEQGRGLDEIASINHAATGYLPDRYDVMLRLGAARERLSGTS